MNYEQLVEQIRLKKSFLCVGLDTDINKIPAHLKDAVNPIFAFNKETIDATADLAVAYKPNVAFYESLGSFGWQALEKTVEYIRKNYPEIFIIADAKRGDIGNTSDMYAKAFFETMDVDALTVAPYMGEDSITPFLKYRDKEKWTIILALTSNKGSKDFQMIESSKGALMVYEQVLMTASHNWQATPDCAMFVVGATQVEWLSSVRNLVPKHFLLIPGVGAQGGDLKEVCKYGLTDECGLLVNNSRSIIYASNGKDFAEAARQVAYDMQQEMASILRNKGII